MISETTSRELAVGVKPLPAHTRSGFLSREESEKVGRETWDILCKKNWCCWKCALFGGDIITIIADYESFNQQLKLGGSGNMPANYPFYSLDELRLVEQADDSTVLLIHELKKIAGARLVSIEESKSGGGI